MSFNKINLDSWSRKYYYDYYMKEENNMRCRVGITANIDITKLIKEIKKRKLRCYPTFTYIISRVINNHDEFKTDLQDGVLGIWDKLNIRYPMFNQKDKTITSIWLEYNKDFKVFYQDALSDIEKYSGMKNMYAKDNFPPNFYDITSIPWVSFTNIQIDMYGTDGTWLMPFVAIGKFFNQNNSTLLPVHIKVHHALCDGYHLGLFFEELQKLCNNLDEWI